MKPGNRSHRPTCTKTSIQTICQIHFKHFASSPDDAFAVMAKHIWHPIHVGEMFIFHISTFILLYFNFQIFAAVPCWRHFYISPIFPYFNTENINLSLIQIIQMCQRFVLCSRILINFEGFRLQVEASRILLAQFMKQRINLNDVQRPR